jgi:hypothetical protein
MTDRASSAIGLLLDLGSVRVAAILAMGAIAVIAIMAVANRLGIKPSEIRISLITLTFQVKFNQPPEDKELGRDTDQAKGECPGE